MVEVHGPPDVIGMFLAAVAAPALVAVRVPQSDPDLAGQKLDGPGEVQPLGFAGEVNGVAFGLTAEAVVDALFGVHRERGGLLPVERAEPHPLGTLLLELGVLGDEPDDVGRVPYAPYVVVHDAHQPNVPPASQRLSGNPAAVGQVRRSGQ